MNKSHQTATRTHSRRFVDKPCSFILQFRERGIDVRYLDRDMVHSWSAFSEKLSDGSIRTQRLEQLDVSVAHREHAYFDALFRDFFGRIDIQPERIAPHGQTIFDAFGGNSDVINLQQPE
jgi:hypothetical protein